jgi:glycosyltransferase involved in cell wall biosynthesis
MRMPSPRVSVVLVSYNHAKFLPQRIDSILSQSFQDFELIILDDHSPDNSIEVIQRYPWDREYRLIPSSTNSGSPFAQWRKGLLQCSGEYVWIAESDDYSSPDFLRAMVETLDADPEIALCYSQSVGVDELGNFMYSYFPWTEDLDATLWRSSFVMDGRDFVRKYISKKCVIPNVSAALFRSSALSAIAFPESWMRHYGDWLLYARTAWTGKVGFVCEDYNFFRFHSSTQRANASVDHFVEYRHVIHLIARLCASTLTLPEKIAIARKHYNTLRHMGQARYNRNLTIRAKSALAVAPFFIPV